MRSPAAADVRPTSRRRSTLAHEMPWRLLRPVVVVVDVACWCVGATAPWLPRWLIRAIETYAVWSFRCRATALCPEFVDLSSVCWDHEPTVRSDEPAAAAAGRARRQLRSS